MNTRPTPTSSPGPRIADFPDADELAMLRAENAGMPVRRAVERYLPERVGAGQSARGVPGEIRRWLGKIAWQVDRQDLNAILEYPDGECLCNGSTRERTG